MFASKASQKLETRGGELANSIVCPLLRTFGDHSTPVALLEASGRVVFINRPFTKWLETRLGRALGDAGLLEAIGDAVSGLRPGDAAKHLAAFMKDGIGDLTVELHSADEPPQWYELSCFRFRSGSAIQMLFVIENVTRALVAEQAADDLRTRILALRDEERQILADELHDSTVQHLVAAELSLLRLKARIQLEGTAQEILQDIEQSVARAMRELRASSYLLHPTELEGGHFSTILSQYCTEFALRTDIAVRLRSDGSVEILSPTAQRAVLRIVQEALMNVHRHAEASSAVVRLIERNGTLHVIVSDNGKATSAKRSAQVRVGVGLSSIRHRLALLGGSLMLLSTKRGTVLHGTIPTESARLLPAAS